MDKELTGKLFKDFPIFFRGHELPATESLMCFGCECGNGWEPLIRGVAEVAEKWNKEHPDEPAVACQIKEKFGTLRMYVDSKSFDLNDAIRDAEMKSCVVCEICGAEGKTRNHGWFVTQCDGCWKHTLRKRKKDGF